MDKNSPSLETETGEWALLASVTIFGVNYPMLKHLIDHAPVHLVNASRLFLSCLTLGILLLIVRDRTVPWARPLRVAPAEIMFIGVIGYYLSPICFLVGMAHSSASSAAIILASAPIWTALFGRWLGVERLPLSGWVALGISFAGSIIVALGAIVSTESGILFGNGLLLLDAVIWGGTIAVKKRAMLRTGPLETTFWSLAVALPFLLMTALPSLPKTPQLFESWTLIGSLLFSGLLSMGIGLYWWNRAVRTLGPTTTGLYGNGIPIVGAITAVLFLGESVSATSLTGMGFIILGIWVIRRYREPSPVPLVGRPPG